MKSFLSKIKFNKKMSENSGKKKKLTTNLATLTLIFLLLISVPVTLFSTTVYAQEPSIEEALTQTGFTNISLTSVETFPPGTYQATFFAEFGFFYDLNSLSYYPVGTSNYQTLFTGSEGANNGTGGYVVPPISKMFTVDSQFGLSMLAQYRYFTEVSRNPDIPLQHAKVYANLDSPNMFLICFEDTLNGYDKDYNDMIISLTQIDHPTIVSVTRTPFFDQAVTVTAQVTKGSAEIQSVILSYQIGSGGWTDVTMSLDGSVYVAEIPAQPSNTQVNYKVTAYDANGYSDVSTLYSYTILIPFIPESQPIALFIYSPDVANTGEDINFDASSS